jgi:hypothetical protein
MSSVYSGASWVDKHVVSAHPKQNTETFDRKFIAYEHNSVIAENCMALRCALHLLQVNYYTTNMFLSRSQASKQLTWPYKNNHLYYFRAADTFIERRDVKLLPTNNLMETVNKKSDLCISIGKVCK